MKLTPIAKLGYRIARTVSLAPTVATTFPALLLLAGAASSCLLLFPQEALARVGGGQSYGGGSHGGSGGGGGGGAIIGIVRILVWLTVEYPAVGVPIDVVVVGFVVYRFVRRGSKQAEAFSSSPISMTSDLSASPLGLDTRSRPESLNREWA